MPPEKPSTLVASHFPRRYPDPPTPISTPGAVPTCCPIFPCIPSSPRVLPPSNPLVSLPLPFLPSLRGTLPSSPNSHLHPVLAHGSSKPRDKTPDGSWNLSSHGSPFPWAGLPPQLCPYWTPRGDLSLPSQLALQASLSASSSCRPPGLPEGGPGVGVVGGRVASPLEEIPNLMFL